MTVWKTTPVNRMPSLRLEQWSVREIEPAGTRHLVGYNLNESEGRVSSAITGYDAQKRLVVTKSGRVYELVGRSGGDSDGEYVWGRWLQINGSPTWRDVTVEYEPSPSEPRPKRARRKRPMPAAKQG